MNAPAFTPGPWKCDAEDARYIRSVKTKEYIAARQSSNPADSALLAAASELYEALRVMVDKATRQNWNDQYPDQLAQAQTALAKAVQP